jgi:hypothetical protein
MKTQPSSLGLQDAADENSTQPQIRLQEQFIKLVKDDSLPASQVLAEQNEHMQKGDRQGSDNLTPLFVP